MFMVDTHIHTCLSPCAELDMHPSAIVDAAIRAGLDSIAVCDHNSAENAAAVQRAGNAAGLAVIPGMEITSSEEVHILGLLPDIAAAMELQSKVYRSLPGRNDESAFGMQVIANEFAEVLGFKEHLLSGATTLNLDRVVAAIHDVDGLAIASHVDREGFGIIGQLGFIPPGLPLDAIEVSQRTPLPASARVVRSKRRISNSLRFRCPRTQGRRAGGDIRADERSHAGGIASRVDRGRRQDNPRRRKADGRSRTAHPGYRAEQPGSGRQRD